MKSIIRILFLLSLVFILSTMLYAQSRVFHHSQGEPHYTEEGFWRNGEIIGFDGQIHRYTYPLMEDEEGNTVPNPARAYFHFEISEPGTYDVEVYFVRGSNRASWVTYEIETLTGRKYTVLDQTGTGGEWHSLGRFSFGQDQYSVTLNAGTSEGGDVVIMDALRINPVDNKPPATLNFVSFPEKIEKDKPFTLDIDYTTNIYQTCDKGRFIIDIYNLPSQEKIHTVLMNNNRMGYDSPQGTVSIDISLDRDIEKPGFAVYFSLSDMNEYFIQYMESLPRDGTHPYRWRGGDGVTQTIRYLDALIVENTEEEINTAFCCGLTYQVFMKGMKIYNRQYGQDTIFNLSAADMRDFFQLWYVSRHADGFWYGASDALWNYQGGYPLTGPFELKKGDFVQIWRHSGSGHSVIFDSWRLDEAGNPIEMRYWSTQTSTNGINFNVEKVSSLNLNPVVDKYKLTTFARVEKPLDKLDRENALAQAATFE